MVKGLAELSFLSVIITPRHSPKIDQNYHLASIMFRSDHNDGAVTARPRGANKKIQNCCLTLRCCELRTLFPAKEPESKRAGRGITCSPHQQLPSAPAALGMRGYSAWAGVGWRSRFVPF
jgi:hypothetical protein